MNNKRFKRTLSFVVGLLIVYFGERWLNQAMEQPTELGRWIMVGATGIVLFVIIYFNMDKNGEF